ncbi:MAG TPA: hypothetical protein VEL07_07155 [Planctomycetota bacterium]|nr:hypothetical protein [Planctomycetota bacterium]
MEPLPPPDPAFVPTSPAQPAPSDPLVASSPVAAPVSRRRLHLEPLQWLGAALIVAAVVLAIVETTEPRPEYWPEILVLIAATGGSWLVARPMRSPGTLSLSALGAGAAIIGFAWNVPWIAWPAAGVCVGAAVRWGYDHRKRAWWFTGAVLLLAWTIAAAAALLRVAEGRGLEWVAAQGVGSLAVGAGLAWLAGRLASRPEAASSVAIASRALVVGGIVLPYAALAAMAIARAA